MIRALAIVLALGLAAQAPAAKSELRKSSRDLKNVKRDLSSAQRQLAKQARVENSLLRQLEATKREVDAKGRDQRTFQHNLEVTEAKLAALARENARASQDLSANRAALARQLRLLHRAGAAAGGRMLLTAQGPAQWMARYRFLKVLATQNASRLAATRADLALIDARSREWKIHEAEYRGFQRDTESARRRLESERLKRESLLKGVRQRKSQTEALVGQLASAAEALSRKMEELRQAAEAAERAERAEIGREERAPGKRPAAQIDRGPSRLGPRRSLPWPVKGALLTRFGAQPHPRFRTTIFNRGVEIGAEAGSAVAAVAAGTARFAGEFDGFGQMVILDHGGGNFSTYANNSALLVKEGERVAAGQAIAEVGESATLGRPSLYFEIRNGAKPQDPLLWLRRKP